MKLYYTIVIFIFIGLNKSHNTAIIPNVTIQPVFESVYQAAIDDIR